MGSSNFSKQSNQPEAKPAMSSIRTENVKGFLKEVITRKKHDVASAERETPLTSVRKKAETFVSEADFLENIQSGGPGHVGVIAEIKKASPSKGDINIDLDPGAYAKKYTEAGACAISVLTEKHFFKGSLEDLKQVRRSTTLPVLRKDFTLSSYQIYEARAAGADAVLLITSILSREQLRDYTSLARELGMEPLVEIHSEWELDKAVFADARIIGINNRNLQTLKTDLNVSKRVVPFFTEHQIPVEASGISCPEDIQKGMASGIFNFLVGESIVRAKDTVDFIQSLVKTTMDTPHPPTGEEKISPASTHKAVTKTNRPWVKICGLTSPSEALACADLGVNAIGVVFYPPSPRSVTPEQAKMISLALPTHVTLTGVFVDETFEFIMERVKACSLKAVQLHGNENPELVKKLKETGVMVIKALFSSRTPGLQDAETYKNATALLVEGGKGLLPGGNAEAWQWKLPDCKDKNRNMIVAGGLCVENIKDALHLTRPWGVDVSSGVESAPGKKDIARVMEFMNCINSVKYS